jgi:hypothetical protein
MRLVMKFKFKFGPRNCQIEIHSSQIAKIEMLVSALKSTFAGNLKLAANLANLKSAEILHSPDLRQFACVCRLRG